MIARDTETRLDPRTTGSWLALPHTCLSKQRRLWACRRAIACDCEACFGGFLFLSSSFQESSFSLYSMQYGCSTHNPLALRAAP